MDSRDWLLAPLASCLSEPGLVAAIGFASIAERWSLVTHAVSVYRSGRKWKGASVLKGAREELWRILTGERSERGLDFEALMDAGSHADDDGGGAWHFAAGATWACVVDGYIALGLGDPGATMEGVDTVGPAYQALRTIATFQAFGDVRDHAEDQETEAAILGNRLYRAERELYVGLAEILGSQRGGAQLARRAKEFSEARRWKVADLAPWPPNEFGQLC